MNQPLEGLLVLDFSQYLSGPSASLRLADLGARIIKIEQPQGGDIGRNLYFSNLILNGESSMFLAINRNKESYIADLKAEQERRKIEKLIAKADVLIHNFRPGVAERLGIDYRHVSAINPQLVYGEITGYGHEGPWKDKPGLDLLIQSVSGLTQLNGTYDAGPVPIGLAVVDILTGIHLSQGILACLYRKLKTGKGGLVQASMLESAIDYQFESITAFFTDGGQPTMRPKSNAAHAYLGAPYGIYATSDGYLALAMASIPQLGELTGCSELLKYTTPESWYTQRDEIREILATHLQTQSTAHWLSILEPADIWCAEVKNWKQLFDTEAFKILNMIQEVQMSDGFTYRTTRCPIRINHELFTHSKGCPKKGEHTTAIQKEFNL